MYDDLYQPMDRSRWRRHALLLAAVTAALVALLLGVIASSASHEPLSLVVSSPAPAAIRPVSSTPTPTTNPTVTASPQSSAVPTPRPRQTEPALPTPTATPTPAKACPQGAFDCADGVPGWSTGYTACRPAAVAADGAGRPPVDGISLTLALPSTARAGTEARGTLTITNRSAAAVTFEVQLRRSGSQAGVSGAGGSSAFHTSDALSVATVELAPGDSDAFEVFAGTRTCGDTSKDIEPELPTGSYRVGVTVHFSGAQRVGSAPGPAIRSSGSWSVAKALRIT